MAPSLLRRHTRTVRLPPLPAFVFLPPKHFRPLTLAAMGLRVDDKRKYTLKSVLHCGASEKEQLVGNQSPGPMSQPCPSWTPQKKKKKYNSHLAFQGGLIPHRVFSRAGWAQLGCWASCKVEESIRLRAKLKPRTQSSASPRFGLILRAAPTSEHLPPKNIHSMSIFQARGAEAGKAGNRGQHWGSEHPLLSLLQN